MKKFSIITTNFNNLAGLRRTRDSIYSQTFRDFEWIVVDGGSTDGGEDYIRKHKEEMTWWCTEQDSGIYNAMNKGVKHAQGEYLLFLNSGDILFAPDTLEKVTSTTLDADVVYGDWTEALPRRRRRKRNSPEKVNFYSFASRPLCHQTAFIRANLLKQSPYDETYRICADWAKWLKLSKNGCTFQHIPITICHFQLGGFSYRAVKERREEHERILREYYPADLAEVFSVLTGKVAKRLKVIRRLARLCTVLLVLTIILAVWIVVRMFI